MSKPKIAILMTCFNRSEITLAALGALPAAVSDGVSYQVFLVDDGSTDGTAQNVGEKFPDVSIIRGSGDLYWNGGMRLAWQSAIDSEESYDFFLWLNDDTELRGGAISDLVTLYYQQKNKKTIVTGRTVDPETKTVTYGGYRRVSGTLTKLRFRHLTEDEVECDTMNGNCVLIPAAAAEEIGINSESFQHAYGDNDYGLRARKHGWQIIELKPPIASQTRNFAYSKKLSRLTPSNWRFILFHPKGISLKEWGAFCMAHGGILWPVNFVFRYLKILRLH